MSAEIISLADRRAVREQRPGAKGDKPSVLELIQQIADNLGIDIEAPFRAKPGIRPQ